MKLFKRCMAAALVLLMAGCGGGGDEGGTDPGSDTSNITYTNYSLSVVDDAVLGAKITATGCSGYEEIGNGRYRLLNCVQKPDIIVASGGSIDFNGNGEVDSSDVPIGIPLTLDARQSAAGDNFIVTPLTTLAAAARNSELDTLAQKLGVSKEELFQDLSKDDAKKTVLRLLNAQFIAAGDNGVIDAPLFLQKFKNYILQSTATDTETSIRNAITALKGDPDASLIFGGIGFNGFITEAESIDVDALTDYYANKGVNPDKTVFIGYVYDEILSGATVKLYVGETLAATATTDSGGKFRLDIDSSLIEEDKIVKLEANLAGYKGDNVVLVSYLTTDMIGAVAKQKISAGDLIDIIISNVTTAEYLVAKKLNGNTDFNDPDTLKEKLLQAQVENIDTVKDTAALIKYIVDTDASAAGAQDTLSYVDGKVSQNLDLSLTAEESSNLAVYTSEIDSDPVLSKQLEIAQNQGGAITLKTLLDSGISSFYSIRGDVYNDNGTVVYDKEYTEIAFDPKNMELIDYELVGNKWVEETEYYDKIGGGFDGSGIFYATDPRKDPFKVRIVSSYTVYNQSSNKSYRLYILSYGIYKHYDDEFYLSMFDGEHNGAMDIDSDIANWSQFEQTYIGTSKPFDERKHIILNPDNTCDSTYWARWERFVLDGKEFIKVYSDYDNDYRLYAIDYANHKAYYKYAFRDEYIGKWFYDVVSDSYDLVTAFEKASDDIVVLYENYDDGDPEQIGDLKSFIENLLKTATF